MLPWKAFVADMVKEGAVVVDVGTTRVDDASREEGGVWLRRPFSRSRSKTSYITPVPGGVGPMTIASLMMNTLKAMELNGNKNIFKVDGEYIQLMALLRPLVLLKQADMQR